MLFEKCLSSKRILSFVYSLKVMLVRNAFRHKGIFELRIFFSDFKLNFLGIFFIFNTLEKVGPKSISLEVTTQLTFMLDGSKNWCFSRWTKVVNI